MIIRRIIIVETNEWRRMVLLSISIIIDIFDFLAPKYNYSFNGTYTVLRKRNLAVK